MSDNTMAQDAIVVERTFNAPASIVWQMWTRSDYFKKWYGPQGITILAAELDVRVGGRHLVGMATLDGSNQFWTVGEFTEIVPNQRLVYTNSLSDEHGNILPAPEGMDDYPMLTVVTVLLEEVDGRTKMTMTHAGLPTGMEGAQERWEESFDQLAATIQIHLNS